MARPFSRRGAIAASADKYASLRQLGGVATRISLHRLRARDRNCASNQSWAGAGAMHCARRLSFVRPVGPELLEVGPQIRNVLVILDADECHAGPRHLLHRRADIFVEARLAPGDAGRFVGRGVVEALEGAGLAT